MISSIVQNSNTSLQDCKKEETLISKALLYLENRLRYHTEQKLNNSINVRSYMRLQLAQEQDEVFAVLFLNNTHHFLGFEKLFHGTINEAIIYPRKVVKKALEHNAAKIIIAHNHPSNDSNPSKADQEITRTLKQILEIINVQLIDHIVVSHCETFSFAEHGLL